MTVFESHAYPFSTVHFAVPFLDFRMTVQEGETTGTVVEGGRKVAPSICPTPIGADWDEPAVVDRIGMLIHHNENPSRAFGITRLLERFILAEAGWIVGRGPTGESVHGNAA